MGCGFGYVRKIDHRASSMLLVFVGITQNLTPDQRLAAITKQYNKSCTSDVCIKQMAQIKKYARWLDPKAQLILGMAYLYGDGRDQNIEKAIKWLNRSAYNVSAKKSKSSLKASHLLTKIYLQGIGIPVDEKKASKLNKKLMDVGYSPALYETSLADFAASNDKKALQLMNQASDNGYRPAIYLLARMYQLGHHVTQDYAKSAHYFNELITYGYKDSRQHLETIIKSLSQISEAEQQLVQRYTSNLAMEVITINSYNSKLNVTPLDTVLHHFKKNKSRYTAATGSRIKGRPCGQTSRTCSGFGSGDLDNNINSIYFVQK